MITQRRRKYKRIDNERGKRYDKAEVNAVEDLIEQEQDYRFLDWNDISNSPGTPGMLMKTMRDGVYYKLSCFFQKMENRLTMLPDTM